jgi:hypothetical protein
VPAGAPVAELLPDVVALAGEPGDAAALPRWSLSGFGGGDLSPATSLESAGVPDGTVLYLRRIDEPAVGLQSADVVERAAAQVSGGATVDRTVLGGAAAAVLVLVAVLLFVDGRPGAGLGAAATAVLALVTGAWMASRPEGVAGAAAPVALTAGPLLAVAAVVGTASTAAPSSGPVRLAAGLAGLAAGAALAALAVRAARVVGSCAAALTAGAAAAVLLSLPLTPAKAAAVTAVAGVLVVPALPRVVLRCCGLRLSDLAHATRAPGPRLDAAHRALPWALAADGALVVVAASVLAARAVGAHLWLTAVCGLLLVLRSRDRPTSSGLPLLLAGLLTLLVTGAGLAVASPGAVGPLLVLGAVALACAGAAVLPQAAVDRPRWAQRRRRLEVLALIAVVPLLAAVLGLFGEVVELARGAE